MGEDDEEYARSSTYPTKRTFLDLPPARSEVRVIAQLTHRVCHNTMVKLAAKNCQKLGHDTAL